MRCAGAGAVVGLLQLVFARAKAMQLNRWDARHLEDLIADEVLSAV